MSFSMAGAHGQGPSIHRSSLLRYKTLWEGSNRAPADGMLAWEQVLRAQAQPDTATGGELLQKNNLRSEPTIDPELEPLSRQFHQLRNDIRTTLEDIEGPRPLLVPPSPDTEPPSPELTLRPPAVEATRSFEDIGLQFAELRDSLHGCADSEETLASFGSPSSIPVPRRNPGFASSLKPRRPSGGVAFLPSPAAGAAELFRAASGTLGVEPPAELANLAVCSLRHVEQLLAAGEARRAAAEVEAGAPPRGRCSVSAAVRPSTLSRIRHRCAERGRVEPSTAYGDGDENGAKGSQGVAQSKLYSSPWAELRAIAQAEAGVVMSFNEQLERLYNADER